MRIVLILAAVFLVTYGIGFPYRGYVPGLLAGLVTYLLIEVAVLRGRIGKLEASIAQSALRETTRRTPPAPRPEMACDLKGEEKRAQVAEPLEIPAHLTQPTSTAPVSTKAGTTLSSDTARQAAQDSRRETNRAGLPPQPDATYDLEEMEWLEQTLDPPKPPVQPMVAPQRPAATAPARTAGAAPEPPPQAASPFPELFAQLWRWLTGGNPILKAGIVVLFFGVAFLLSYAAQRNMFPIELRLAGVAAGALALLLLGWRLRQRHTLYGLSLEGAGIGILYLVVFAAAKLYHLLPLPLALAVMIGLVGLSCALAILQDARGLAVAGSVGGFLAPVLMSSGGGSHVLLFSYYALLNSGILAIAWYRSWRELNLTGFVFTFGIAGLWGASSYTPVHFATTEPFLVLFFAMYCLISVLFAHRQPLHLRGYIDGPLVFGLPVVAGGFQAALVADFRYGLAFSALALGGWYIGLARLLWNRVGQGMRLLTEAFLALGIVFASLAIPFGFDPHWTSAAWAIEGAAMVWVGIRQNRVSARIFGMLLQLGAAISFATSSPIDATAMLFANRFFLGCGLIATAALLSADWLEQDQDNRPENDWESFLSWILLVWGVIWWYGGGIADLARHVHGQDFFAGLLLFTVVSTAGFAAVAHWCGRQRLVFALLLLLPCMLLVWGFQFLDNDHIPLLSGGSLLAWPLAMVLQYGLLFRFEDELPEKILFAWHRLTLWLLLAAVTLEIARRVDQLPGLAGTWELACWGAVPAVLLILLEWRGDRLAWPVERFAPIYHGTGTDVPLAVLLLWTVISLAANGNPAPLPYLPLCNPLELAEAAVLLLAGYRIVRKSPARHAPGLPLYLVVILTFLWLNTMVGRSIHVFAEVPYRPGALFASSIMQAALAALWSTIALALTVWSARNNHRQVWLAGAGLLGLTVVKLFFVDLAGTGAIGRIVSFLVVGMLMMAIGFFAPLPPKNEDSTP
ncbi:DUF2339 domain-containing protein [Desulfobulbus sp.]|uniref:DUF2339 domain-containing protein n=1 Tax=Desulfobulbus sp. TaxID=895 RepID=UPI00286EC16A|nr:DUF2339 domain-containing protein [Desulfobulbus sp.]